LTAEHRTIPSSTVGLVEILEKVVNQHFYGKECRLNISRQSSIRFSKTVKIFL